nr:alcohol dehydrogenase catalytic domain-containing protein [Microbacterium sp. Se63.02b]
MSVGRVIATGDAGATTVDGTSLRIGDRVVWSVTVSCAHCDRCTQGMPQKCRTLGKYGMTASERTETSLARSRATCSCGKEPRSSACPRRCRPPCSPPRPVRPRRRGPRWRGLHAIATSTARRSACTAPAWSGSPPRRSRPSRVRRSRSSTRTSIAERSRGCSGPRLSTATPTS